MKSEAIGKAGQLDWLTPLTREEDGEMGFNLTPAMMSDMECTWERGKEHTRSKVKHFMLSNAILLLQLVVFCFAPHWILRVLYTCTQKWLWEEEEEEEDGEGRKEKERGDKEGKERTHRAECMCECWGWIIWKEKERNGRHISQVEDVPFSPSHSLLPFSR